MGEKDNNKRNARYWRLKAAGFTGIEANKYKDRAEHIIIELINIKMEYKTRINEILGGS